MQFISHRGICRNATENTLAAFAAAVAAGFRHIETDLRTTKDGKIILCHDPDLKRLAGRGDQVHHLTARELQAIPLSHDGRLCLLEDALAAFPDVSWTFDIKRENGERTVDELLGLIARMGRPDFFREQVHYLFWSQSQEKRFCQKLPAPHLYARQAECYAAGMALLLRIPLAPVVAPGKTYSLPPRAFGLNLYQPSFVARLHKHGLKALAFLPASRQGFDAAKACGFDEILLNDLPD